jgi:glycerol-3-phosphate O-acyltransferase
MESIVISSDNKKDLQLVQQLVKKMGLRSRYLTAADIEDYGLLAAMLEADRKETVSKEDVINILNETCR